MNKKSWLENISEIFNFLFYCFMCFEAGYMVGTNFDKNSSVYLIVTIAALTVAAVSLTLDIIVSVKKKRKRDK